jgi:hypothetical protein
MAKTRKKKSVLGSKKSRHKHPPKLKELVRKITPQNRYAEISVGPELGRERVEW